MINEISHKMNESITDPLPYSAGTGGWWDANTTNGGEIGDQCNFIFGDSLGSTPTGTYEQLINGNPLLHPERVEQRLHLLCHDLRGDGADGVVHVLAGVADGARSGLVRRLELS
ncbi:MAG: hypothetical protein M3065_23070 [Actinomycetota bacterium]|nr:hypothetical protein [Actinomycetota bacterium]